METLADTLMERVSKLVSFTNKPSEWGDPRLSTTPTSVAVAQLARRAEALEQAVLEIAREVEKLSEQPRSAAG